MCLLVFWQTICLSVETRNPSSAKKAFYLAQHGVMYHSQSKVNPSASTQTSTAQKSQQVIQTNNLTLVKYSRSAPASILVIQWFCPNPLHKKPDVQSSLAISIGRGERKTVTKRMNVSKASQVLTPDLHILRTCTTNVT